MESQNRKKMCSSRAEAVCKLLYDLDDELAECRIFVQQRKALKKSMILLNPLMEFLFERQRKKQFHGIRIRFEELGIGETQSSPLVNLPTTSGTSSKSEIFGFEDTAKKIENMLFRKIIGICGKVGTGKSVLAKSVFNSEKVSNQFARKIWLCLSDIKKIDEKDIGSKVCATLSLNSMLDLKDFKDLESKPFDILQSLLSQADERYLLVFDDVRPWHTKFLFDEMLSGGLGSNGAVIITSRLQGMARRMKCDKLVHLQPPLFTISDPMKISEQTLTSDISNGSSILQNIICEAGYQSIGICGMGGSGKTTLTRKVFNSEKVGNMFLRRIWFCLSQIQRTEEDIEAMISKMILNELGYDVNEHIMDRNIIEPWEAIDYVLSGDRFLIVFDDVWPWHADFLVAEIHSRRRLRGGGSGGAVIVTSRLPEVARRFGGDKNLIQLHPSLLEKDCWKIFYHSLKSGFSDESNIEEIVQQTLGYNQETWNSIRNEAKHNCHGLPLAAGTLGEILLDKIKNPEGSSLHS